MPTRTFRNYQVNQAWDNRWYIFESTVTTDILEWMVLVQVNVAGNFNIKGESKPCGYLALVGKKSAIPGSVFTESHVLEDAQYHSEQHSRPPFSDQTASSYVERAGYTYWGTPYGSQVFGAYEPDYVFANAAAFNAALDAGEIYPTVDMVYFDVYVNGSDQPSIFVNWTATNDLSVVTMAPEVYIAADADSLIPWIVTDEQGVAQPNTARWNIDSAGSYNYAGSYQTTYMSITDHFADFLNPSNRVIYWGLDGIPDTVYLYLRMDDGEQIGDLYRVNINKDGTASAAKIDGSSYNARFNTAVRLHSGEPDYVLPDDDDEYASGHNFDDDDDGRYSDDTIPDFSTYEGNGFDGNAILTRTYAVSDSTLQNVGQKLWSQSYFDVLKIQSNPIENVIACKAFPFALTGTETDIQVGDVSFGINGDKVSSVQLLPISSGFTYTGKFGNYMDLPPYTVIKINLPYCGLIQVDAADLFNSELKVRYAVDLVTGQCMAMLTLDGIPYMNVFGQMGVDIPLTATDRVQTELRAASSALSAVNGAAGHLIAGDTMGGLAAATGGALTLAGMDYTSQRTTSLSPACATFANHAIYALIERPLENPESVGYKHLHGYPCHKYLKLADLADDTFQGGAFVQIDSRSDIRVAMTSEENEILESMLTAGVYI